MINKNCPNKGTWMCNECDGICEQCEVGELYPRPTTGLSFYQMLKYTLIGYGIGLVLNFTINYIVR